MKVKLVNENITSNYGEKLLNSRGVQNVRQFLEPTKDCLQDWNDLENIKEGVELIQNISPHGKIALVVDCDVDGFTSSSIIYQYLKKIYPLLQIEVYIHDGKAHGLEEHWEEIDGKGYNLIIIPDAGSNDSQYAAQIDAPILVIDHHIIDEEITAKNMTVINNQLSPRYNNKDLSGAGVVYQFCRALDYYMHNDYATNFIDLAALGICADMMSGLEIENQYFWKEGFSKINNYFFLILARKQAYSITGKVGATDQEIIDALNPTSVAFYIVPLINAMIRVGTQAEKERLWLAFVDGHKLIESRKKGAKGTLEEVAVESARECTNARTHQNKIKDEAVSRLEQKIFKYDLLENKVLFIRLDDGDNFPAELNGLVAMQLSQRYKKPTIVARLNDQGYIRGSIRGLSNSELKSFKDYLTSTKLFEYVQGHDNAAGCSILASNLSSFHQKANIDLADYDFGDSYYEVEFERQAYASDLENLILDLSRYKDVWSQKNNEPMIHITGLRFKRSEVQIMGKNKDTIKIVKNGVAYMKFFGKNLIEELKQFDDIEMEIVGKANLNYWGGTYTPQIFIEAYEIKEDNILVF